MKKFLLTVFLFVFCGISVNAEKFPDLPYPNINNKDKISYDDMTDSWSKKIDKKSENYYIKTKGFGDYYDYLNSHNEFAFSTNCEYEFIYNEKLIGYSNTDLKLYDISYINGGMNKRELSKEEIQKILKQSHLLPINLNK